MANEEIKVLKYERKGELYLCASKANMNFKKPNTATKDFVIKNESSNII